jgi:SAM-dependent methyltransferase
VSSACSFPTALSELSEHARVNQSAWTGFAADYVAPAERAWAAAEPSWGIWGVPESDVGALRGIELAGAAVVELGCGTAYWSAWFARRGAAPVGIDVTEAQLATARRMQAEHGLSFPLIQASAEDVPLADGGFDLAFSEYGASIWCDPYRWIPEAARLLRPGGRLIFVVNGTLQILCSPDSEDEPVEDKLLRDYFGMYRFEWPGDNPPTVEFHLGYGDWIRLLRSAGFEVENLIEVRAPALATTRYPWASAEWARRWPSEEIWVARKHP